MHTTAITSAATTRGSKPYAEPVKLLKRIGSTTYRVDVHFSNSDYSGTDKKSESESLEDKILRLICREAGISDIIPDALKCQFTKREVSDIA